MRLAIIGPEFHNADGCRMGANMLPGGHTLEGSPNEGITAIHKIRHWFGLFHPFQGEKFTGPGKIQTPYVWSESRGDIIYCDDPNGLRIH